MQARINGGERCFAGGWIWCIVLIQLPPILGCSGGSSPAAPSQSGSAATLVDPPRAVSKDLADHQLEEPGEQPNPATGSLEQSAAKGTTAGSQLDPEAFRMAAYNGDLAAVKRALQAGMDVHAADDAQRLTALHMAAYNGHTQVVQQLLESGAEVDAVDHEGKTALTHACTGPFRDTVAVLLDGGADVNHREATEGFTPLMMAAGLGQVEIVKLLLQHDADPGILDRDDERALDHARNSGHVEIMNLLGAQSK